MAIPAKDSLLPSLLAALTLGFGAIISLWWLTFVHEAGRAQTPTALIFPPHWDGMRAFAAAAKLDAAIVESGRAENVLVILPLTDLTLPKIRQTGALFIVRADGAPICGTLPDTVQRNSNGQVSDKKS